ncbi:MAG: potassium channel family protein [Chloroflexaceae bacterium]|nr:potassium channel family protein [Chloroflexaceae bacterium]
MNQRETLSRNPSDQQQPKIINSNYQFFILVLSLLSLIMMFLLLLLPNEGLSWEILNRVDNVICLIFLVDFTQKMYHAPNKAAYFLHQGGWLDLLSSIPFMSFLRILRLSRILRVLRDIRRLRSSDITRQLRERRAESSLLGMLLAFLLLLSVGSRLILVFEQSHPDATIQTAEEALWWTFVTMTTVGYGDFYPVTTSGRVLAVLVMTFGVGLFGVVTSYIAAAFLKQPANNPHELASLRAELASLRALLDAQRDREQAQRAEEPDKHA